MTPVVLAALLNADLLATPGDDAVCLGSGTRTTVTIPVGIAAEALFLHWTAVGPATQGGPAAAVDLRFTDGTSSRVPAMMGDEVGAPGAPGRHALPEQLGVDPQGAPVFGKAWSLITGRTDVAVKELVITSRAPTHRLCLVALDAGVARSTLEVTDTRDWYPFIVGPSLSAPLPTASPIEAPAGRRGAVTLSAEGHLTFADGTRSRFWGVDIYQQRAMPPKDQADAYAATLAHLGINMVRLHHIDFNPAGLVNPKRGLPGQPPLLPEMQDRLDFFISRLKAHGIYLFLEAATYRELDTVDGVNHPGGIPNGHKLVPMWEDDWFDAYVVSFRALWGRTNPYTGLRYADDPMVAVVELSNEHSLLANWGGGIETLPTPHLLALDARWNAWLSERYPTDEALAAAWVGGNRGGLEPGESLLTATVRRSPAAPAFRSGYAPRRTDDLYRFYFSLEEHFYARLTDAATEMGFHAPMVSTLNYARPDLLRLGSRWQVQDMHFEWDYPANNTLRASSVLSAPREQELLDSAANATLGRAFTVSELNEAAPNPYQAEAPLVWATMASVQDWDALIWNSYALSDEPAAATYVSDPFDIRASTVKLAQSATASSLFRAGWITPAGGLFPVYWDEPAARLGGAFGEQDRPAELGDIAFWLSHRIRSEFGAAPSPRVDGAASPGVGWWADPGVLFIDRPEIQARIGPPAPPRGDGAGPRAASGLRVESAQWAAVSLATVDGAPLGGSRRALLALGTRQENTGMAWEQGGTRIAAMGTAPVLVEPFTGTITFAWSGRPTLHTLGPDGTPTSTLPVKPAGRGWWRVVLDSTVRTPLILVETAPG